MTILNSIFLAVDSTVTPEGIDYKLIMTVISALSGAIIGGGITIWYKHKEVKNLSESLRLQSEGLNLQSKNLDLQKQVFEENSKNNELKMKAELVRLEDLNRQYQLNIQKHDFEHLSKVLDFAGDSNDKVKMLKEFSNILKEYKPSSKYYYDQSEYEEYTINYVYDKLQFIEEKISQLLIDYPNVFNTLHKDFTSVKGDANYLIAYSGEISSYHDQIDDEYIINQLSPNLLKLNESFYGLLKKMQEEFLELDTLKKQYIRSQFDKRAEEKTEEK